MRLRWHGEEGEEGGEGTAVAVDSLEAGGDAGGVLLGGGKAGGGGFAAVGSFKSGGPSHFPPPLALQSRSPKPSFSPTSPLLSPGETRRVVSCIGPPLSNPPPPLPPNAIQEMEIRVHAHRCMAAGLSFSEAQLLRPGHCVQLVGSDIVGSVVQFVAQRQRWCVAIDGVDGGERLIAARARDMVMLHPIEADEVEKGGSGAERASDERQGAASG